MTEQKETITTAEPTNKKKRYKDNMMSPDVYHKKKADERNKLKDRKKRK